MPVQILSSSGFLLVLATPPAPPTISYPTPRALATGTPDIFAPSPVAAPRDRHSVTTGAVPAGMAVDELTGIVSGTPTLEQTGSFKVTRTSPGGATESNSVVFSVVTPTAPTISYTTPRSLTIGAPSFFIPVVTGGGNTYALTSGTLPTGMGAIDPDTGVSSGTPTLEESGSFVVTATNNLGSTESNEVFWSTHTAANWFTWTTIPPLPVNARAVFVTTAGDDLNDGLSEETPKATWWGVAGAMSLMRDGFGDRTLLKRGDVFTPPLDNAHRFVVQGGESEIAPAMLWSYGTADAHPEIRNACVQVGFGGNPTRHMWVVGIDIINRDGMSIYYPATNPGVNNVGMSVEPYFGDDVLVEDCHIIGWGANLQAGPRGDNSFAGRLHNFRLRGCVIADAFYLGDASSQGFNCGSLSYPLMERCVVDHNGWSEEGVDDLSILNQNIYFYQNCNNITTRWNISMRACANGCQQRNGGLGEQSIFVNNPFHNLHGSTDGADHSIVRYCSYNGGRDLGLPDDNNGQQGSVGINTGTAVPNSVLQADFFTDSAGGDIDLNTADRFWQYPLVGGVQFRRWNVFGGAGTPVQQNGLAVATGGAFMKSTSANPVYCCEALDIGEGGNTIHEDDNQYSIVPMDPDLGPVSIFIRAQGSPGDDGHVFETLYRLELSRDEFGHDFVAIVERVAGVETDLVRTDLGDHAWTWGSEADTPADADVFSGDITTGVAHIRRGAPTGDGLGELLASSDIDNAQLLRAGPCGILLSGLNQRVYHVEVHSLYVYADVEVAECLFTGVDAEDVLRAKICMGISASGGRLNVHDNISYDFGVFQIQGAVLTAGPFYITNNVFVVPDSASEHYILYWEELVDPTPLIVFSGNGWYLGSGIYWNFNHQGIRTTNPSVWIAHSDETDGTYSIYPSMTPPAYLDPTRGPSTYEGYLERPATITEWYAHAREMNKNVAGSGINVPDFLNWQRAGFNKGPVPSV